MRNEMLGPIEHRNRRRCCERCISCRGMSETGVRFGDRQRVDLFCADGRKYKLTFALLALAGHQNAGGTPPEKD